jgi:Fe-S cluster biogenesis protein NfuA
MEDNTVTIRLLGTCGNCPYSIQTLKNGIETAMVKAIPEIRAVEAVSLDI